MKTTKAKTSKRPAGTVEYIQVYPDGSGAPAKVSHGRYVYACDMLGEIKMNLIAPKYGTRIENKIAYDVCRRAYEHALAEAVDADWLHRNTEMYK